MAIPFELDELLRWMRDSGVEYASVNGMELELGPAPKAVIEDSGPATDTRSPEQKRADWERTMYGAGARR